MQSTDKVTSVSFPNGIEGLRSEDEARADRRLSIVDVIQRGAEPVKRDLPKPCPFCGEDPPLASRIAGRFIVGCENDDCGSVQFSGATPEEAWSRWNTRALSLQSTRNRDEPAAKAALKEEWADG